VRVGTEAAVHSSASAAADFRLFTDPTQTATAAPELTDAGEVGESGIRASDREHAKVLTYKR